MALTALASMLCAIVRAAVQSITIDEADSFLLWSVFPTPSHWEGSASNHVLNSILIRLSVAVFGVSHFTVRLPALIGGAIYIATVYWFCRLISSDTLLQLTVFICFVFNPFVLDHLVAARGYSLAVAFLMVAIVAVASFIVQEEHRQSLIGTCALCSFSTALSLSANFSFAIVNMAAMLAIFLWAWRRIEHTADAPGNIRMRGRRLALLAACSLPACAVVLVVSAPAILSFPRSELVFGAKSLNESLNSIVESSLFELNPELANPIVYPALQIAARYMPALLGIVWMCQVFLIFVNRSWKSGSRSAMHRDLGAIVIGTLALSSLIHWVAFKLFHIPLPKDRTALFVVPLCMSIVGITAAFPARGATVKFGRRALVTVLCVAAVYFLFCLRMRYFKEWKWDAEVKPAYDVVAFYNHAYGVTNMASSWFYVSALNFYRFASGRETVNEFINVADRYPTDSLVYVLNYTFDLEFMTKQKLKIVYHGALTDVVVAIRPEIERLNRPCHAAVP